MGQKIVVSGMFNELCRVVYVGALLSILYTSGVLGLGVSSGSFTCSGNDTCALLQFKQKLLHEGEPALASWSSTDVRDWRWVTWQVDPHGHYRAVTLELGGLQLQVKAGIHDIAPLLTDGLTSLEVLNISGNIFHVKLPRTLRVCPPLQVLDLSNSSFYGFLPQGIDCAENDGVQPDALNVIAHHGQNLRVLNLSNNSFAGEAVESLFWYNSSAVLNKLSSVNLASNGLTGRIPYSLTNCTSLTELNLSSNFLSGTIPEEVGNLSHLKILDFRNNALVGTIPRGIGSLSSLQIIDLSLNNLTGMIPEEIGNLSRLESLDFGTNHLTGTFSAALAKLTNLRVLRVSNNRLRGVAPEISHLTSLRILSLNRNFIEASASMFAHLLNNCTNLRSLWLGKNEIVGSIPPELGNASKLEVFSVFGNQLEGELPAEVGTLSLAKVFDVSFNGLSGGIPHQLCALPSAHAMLLNNNRLSGTIPDCIGNFSYVRYLDFSKNILIGEIPSQVGLVSLLCSNISQSPAAVVIQDNLIYVEYLFQLSPVTIDLSANFLTGSIPASLGYLTKVQKLDLHHNFLSGEIPAALGNMAALFSLDLSSNNLSGMIPTELTQLTFLSELNLSYNVLLEGPIPYTYQFAIFTKSSFLGDLRLCGTAVDITCGANAIAPPSNATALPSSDVWENWVSSVALIAGFAFGYLATWATITLSRKARRYIFSRPQARSSSDAYVRRYGVFQDR